MVKLTINGTEVEAADGTTVLAAAEAVGIYIPRLCSHPNLPPGAGSKPTGDVYRGPEPIKNVVPENELVEYEGCQLCLVLIEGHDAPQQACNTVVAEGMVVLTDTPEIKALRQENLSKILATHPHACLTCAQREGCTREPCSLNVPVEERCCEKFGRCELQQVADYIGIKDDTPRYIPQKLPVVDEEPLFVRDYNLCIECTRCVRACRDLRGIDALGFAFDGETFVVGPTAKLLSDSGCKFCGACIEVCPTGALLDKETVWTNREDALLPCIHDCPVEIDIPRYIRLVAAGDYTTASSVIRERTMFPNVLAHVCHHPCEEHCRRTDLNGAICILGLKRVAIEHTKTEDWTPRVTVRTRTNKHVAIVGSGPTGLTAAYYLTILGHRVTVFEALPEPGGMLRYGIPRYRLPREVLDKDLEILNYLGIDFQTNTMIGENLTIPDLQQNHDAVLVAIGAQQSRKIVIAGDNLQGVLWGLEFLRRVNMDQPPDIGRQVVVVGGGSVAVDVARTSLRLGAEKVMLVCLEPGDEMPAHDWEIQEAKDEGVELYPTWGPKRILGKNGHVSGVELVCCTCVFDEEGKFNPSFDEGQTKTLAADMVILAIGQSVDLTKIGKGTGLEQSKAGTIVVEKKTLETKIPGVFAAGDAVDGPSSVVEALAAGWLAASSIDKFLGGTGVISEEFGGEKPPAIHRLGRDKGFAGWSRAPLPLLPADQRRTSFEEVELTLPEKLAADQARRCLQCDLRLLISSVTLPPEEWLDFEAGHITQVPTNPGVFILADEEKTVLKIKGTENLREALQQQLLSTPKAKFFKFEEDPMYTQRETELLQQYLQEHGKMPGEDELDDLF
ncbi:MAG: FAD-dependent oxidoreductase [Promethearchaeota archaeon]